MKTRNQIVNFELSSLNREEVLKKRCVREMFEGTRKIAGSKDQKQAKVVWCGRKLPS